MDSETRIHHASGHDQHHDAIHFEKRKKKKKRKLQILENGASSEGAAGESDQAESKKHKMNSPSEQDRPAEAGISSYDDGQKDISMPCASDAVASSAHEASPVWPDGANGSNTNYQSYQAPRDTRSSEQVDQPHDQKSSDVVRRKREDEGATRSDLPSSAAAESDVPRPEPKREPLHKVSETTTSKQKKNASVFRVKVGSIAALRFDPSGNSVEVVRKTNDGADAESVQRRKLLPSDALVHVWADPVAGRDESLALIGKRIRCHFAKRLVEGKKRRVLEGEVVRIVDYLKRKPGKPWKVELLIERGMLQQFDFLTRVDEDVDLASFPNEKSRRNYRNEIRIRGENKVIVKMRLQHPGSPHAPASNCVQWAVQKLVPAKLFHAEKQGQGSGAAAINGEDGSETPAESGQRGASAANPARRRARSPTFPSSHQRHMGDGNDEPGQQIANWRWLVSRYHDLRGSCDGLENVDHGLVGKVMKVEAPTDGRKTLALVTLQRLILPEHTSTGRRPFHRKMEVFRDESSAKQFIVPVEQLVVIGASLKEECFAPGSADAWPLDAFAEYSYSLRSGVFGATAGDDGGPGDAFCHRCTRKFPLAHLRTCDNEECIKEFERGTNWCSVCVQSCHEMPTESNDYHLPCCCGICDCSGCRSKLAIELDNEFNSHLKEKIRRRAGKEHTNRYFGAARGLTEACDPMEFELDSFLDVRQLPAPAPNAVKRVKSKAKEMKKFLRKEEKKGVTWDEPGARNQDDLSDKEDYSVFKPSCARESSYDSQKRMKRPLSFGSLEFTDMPRNLREIPSALLTETDPDDKTNQSRAARANQRRMFKHVSSFSGLGADMLTSRESQLRFGRSGIHGWGVFSDRDIAADTMIVEYRGEIINNARAEKREKEYERAKLGSDYMFRIDKDTVCDATKLGNVARFINASCDANCYAKIITVEGNKRIAVYAKKDISEGEELSYDYKFPHEYDPSKRIPCLCGTPTCRGFLNWDKRYVALPDAAEAANKVDGPPAPSHGSLMVAGGETDGE